MRSKLGYVAFVVLAVACGDKVQQKMQSETKTTSTEYSGTFALNAQQQACANAFVAEFNSFQVAALTLSKTLGSIDIQSLSQSQNTIENAKKGFSLADSVNPQITDAVTSTNPLDCSPLMSTYLARLKQNISIAHANAVQAQQNWNTLNQATVNAAIETLKPKVNLTGFGLADPAGSITDSVVATSQLGDLPVDQAMAIIRSGTNLFITIMAEHMATRIAESSASSKLVDRVSRPLAKRSLGILSGTDFKAEVEGLKTKLVAAMRLDIALPPAASVGVLPRNAEESAAVDKTFADIINIMAIVQANHVMSAQQLTTILHATTTQKIARDLARRIISSVATRPAAALPVAAARPNEPVLSSVALNALRGLSNLTLELLSYSSALDSRASLMIISLAQGTLAGVSVSALPDVSLDPLPTDGAISNSDYLILQNIQMIALQNAAAAQQQSVTAGHAATVEAVSAALSK